MGKKRTKKTDSLKYSIEKQVDNDRLAIEVISDNLEDRELLEFTRAFLADFQRIPRLPEVNLLTPGEARKAVEMLQARKEALDQKLKAVGVLKKLLQKRVPGDAYN